MAIRSISVRNLRSLQDTQRFKFAPLVFAVGANSAGKSTFLKLMPLLRQSSEESTRGPILWFGKYVDLGLFDSVISRTASEQEIEFKFELDVRKAAVPKYGWPVGPRFLDDGEITVSLTVSANKGLTYTKRLKISLFEAEIEILANEDGKVKEVLLNGNQVSLGATRLEISATRGLFSITAKRRTMIQTTEGSTEAWVGGSHERMMSYRLSNHVSELYHGKAGQDKWETVASRLGIGTRKSLLEDLRFLAGNTTTSRANAFAIREDSDWLSELHGLVMIDRFPLLVSELNNALARTFAGVRYMGPIRAVAQRYYRVQDLGVNEVDQSGENLPMFLMGLSSSRRQDFSDWCDENIGISIKTKVEGAHVSLLVNDSKTGDSFNVADMGFGYSQVLPLLATIWLAVYSGRVYGNRTGMMGSRRSRLLIGGGGSTIVIEQPELHLHPKMQARFADLLVGVASLAKAENVEVTILCETHSEVIINRIGSQIADGRCDSDAAKVYLFEKKDGVKTEVSEATFNSDGVLMNWPFGFFQPEL